MNNPKISIIIPAYNHAKELPKCLDSIFAQTILPPLRQYGGQISPPYKGGELIEVIAVNDGSTDGTEEVLARYVEERRCAVFNGLTPPLPPSRGDTHPFAKTADNLLRLYGGELKIINQQNQGAPVARNNGFKISKGEYLLFCDADAVLRKDALEKMVGALENSHKSSIVPLCRAMQRENNGAAEDKIGYVYPNHKFGEKKFRIFPFDGEKLKENNYIHTMALIRREAFPKEGFDPSLKKFQDWDLWLTILENGYIGIWLDEFLFACSPRGKEVKGEFLPKSLWLPSFMHKIPWKKFGIKIKAIEDYEYWRDVVLRKHGFL